MRAKQLGHTREVQGIKIELLQVAVHGGRMLHHIVGDIGHRPKQCLDKHLRYFGVMLVFAFLLFAQGTPLAANPVQSALERRRCGFSQGFQMDVFHFSGIHLARAVDHVVRLINQHAYPPLVGVGHAVQHGAHIEIVVVVANDHI